MSPRQRSEPQGISMAPVAIIVVLIAAIAGFLALNSSAKETEGGDDAAGSGGAAAPADPGSDPFADMDPVEAPKTYEHDTAPAGLLENADYVRAMALAEDGIALVDEAIAAREAGDEDTYKAKARAGRDKIFEAKALTTDWLMELQDKYPKDRQVRRIETSRRDWDRALKKVKNLN